MLRSKFMAAAASAALVLGGGLTLIATATPAQAQSFEEQCDNSGVCLNLWNGGPYVQTYGGTTGNNNIALGWEAGDNLTTGSNNIEIGSPGVPDEDSTIRLGTQGTQTATFIAGVSSTAIMGVDVVVGSDGQLGVAASSLRYKRDVRSLDNRSQRLWQLRPVTFRYKQDPQGQRQYGLIAEEVAKVFPELVVRGSKGELESVQYRELIPLMLNEMQHQQAAVATLKAENASLEARLSRLEESRTVASR